MGTDIHMIGQYKFLGKWYDFEIAPIFTSRDYGFFAVLANVRNGFGFAGCDIFSPIKPIAMPRGFPDDFVFDYEKEELKANKGEEAHALFYGEHTPSWLSLTELKKYKIPTTECCGIITLKEYLKWDGKEPEEYCGGVYGNFVTLDQKKIKNEKENLQCDYVKVYWEEEIVSSLKWHKFLTYLEMFKYHSDKDDDIRIIFNFDS